MACKICGRDDNRIMCRKGTGICCLTCQKIADDDIDVERALDYLWSINTPTAAKVHTIILVSRENQNGSSK